MPVPEMHRVEEDVHGRYANDLAGGPEWQQAKAPPLVQPSQDPRGETTDAAVSVIENEETLVAG